jgi:aryl-phospho-beta-D-glucosidase BglC (GH1 family)
MKKLPLFLLYLLATVFFNAGDALESKMDYWNIQRKGANYFNQTPSADWFAAAKEMGIQFVRFAPDKWKCEKRDFLIGDADSFTEISYRDLEVLNTVLDQAQYHDIKVVITLLSLPGSRWKQNNQNKDDLRIWEQKEYRDQALHFWQTLAWLLKDHPAIAGYNILNEPHPERLSGISDYTQINFQSWHESIRGSLADLNLFYHDVVSAIREVDPSTPIIVDTGLYATPWAITYLQPIEDEKIVYSFHMYEPYAYTTRRINNGQYAYPGAIPSALEAASIDWNSETLANFFLPVIEWQKKYHVPSSRIFVGEFGCDRTAAGAEKYLSTLIEIFNTQRWHWAFYSFREDCWDSMDYELGCGNPHWTYWEALEQRANLDNFRKDNSLFEVIKNEFLWDFPMQLSTTYKELPQFLNPKDPARDGTD